MLASWLRYYGQRLTYWAVRIIPSCHNKHQQVTGQEAGFINERLLNMMRMLKMIPGETAVYDPPVEIRKRTYITSEHTGIFVAETVSGKTIRKGTVLGRITDFHGNRIQEVVSPADGFVIYMLSTPPVNRGEILFSLAVAE